MKYKLLASTILASTLTTAFLIQSESAQAFTWDQENHSFFTVHDGEQAGADFMDIFFRTATVNGNDTQGLTGEARFELAEDYVASTKQAKFKVTLKNTTDNNIWSSSRLSGLAFNVDPDINGASAYNGVFNQAHLNRNLSSGVGTVDVCYNVNVGNSCNGGASGGVTLGQTATFYTTLTFGQATTSFTLDKFYSRWQSLNSLDGQYNGASGVGYGEVPTPALIPSLLMSGIAALRRKQKQKEEGKDLVQQAS